MADQAFSYAHGGSEVPLIGETIGVHFDRTVARWPDRPALVVRRQDVRWTWKQLGEQVDALGLESQRRAAEALKEGRFDRSLVTIYHDDGTVALDHEEFPRPETTAEGLAKLTPSFSKMIDMRMEQSQKTMMELVNQVYPQVDELNHVGLRVLALEQVAAHVVHGSRESFDFLRALRGDGGREIALAEALGSIRERLQRRTDAPREQQRDEQRDARERHRRARGWCDDRQMSARDAGSDRPEPIDVDVPGGRPQAGEPGDARRIDRLPTRVPPERAVIVAVHHRDAQQQHQVRDEIAEAPPLNHG